MLHIVTVTSSAAFLVELQQLEDELFRPFPQNFICVWVSVLLLSLVLVGFLQCLSKPSTAGFQDFD